MEERELEQGLKQIALAYLDFTGKNNLDIEIHAARIPKESVVITISNTRRI